MAGCARRIPWRFVAPILVLSGIVAAIVPLARAGRRAAWRAQRANNLKQIGLALHNYYDAYDCLPTAVTRDAQGRPMASWRLRIMPYVEAWTLWMYYSRPWEDLACLASPFARPPFYCCRSGTGPQSHSETNIVAITGPGTAYDVDRRWPMADLSPGTILAIEIKDSGVFWPEPGDLELDTIPESITAGIDGDGVHVLFADGTVWYLHKEVPLDDLKKFFTVENAKLFRREDVLRPYAH